MTKYCLILLKLIRAYQLWLPRKLVSLFIQHVCKHVLDSWHFDSQLYYYRAVASAINVILWSGIRHWKRHKHLIDLLRDLKTFADVELVFQSEKFQMFLIFNMLASSCLIPGYQWSTQSRQFCCYLWIYGRSKMFKNFQIFSVLFCLKKPVLVSAQAQSLFSWRLAKQNCREMIIAQPTRQLHGWLRWQIKDI